MQSLNQEEQRIASLINEKTEDVEVRVKVDKVIELTKASRDEAVVALYDSDYDVTRAVNKILEGDADESGWTQVSKTKEKTKAPVGKSSENKPVNGTTRNGTGHPKAKKEGEKPVRNREQRPHDGQRGPRGSNKRTEEDEDSAETKPRRDNREARGPRRDGRQDGREFRQNDRGETRGGFSGRGRGSRTFSNQQRSQTTAVEDAASNQPQVPSASTDDFPNSIETWSNTTVDPDAKPAPVPITSMTVGNWSDVVSGGNEDWSEEDYDQQHRIQSKVFVPTGRPITEHDESMPSKASLNDNLTSRQPQELVRKEQAGAQILQSLQHQQQTVQQVQRSPQQVPPIRSAPIQQQQQVQQQQQPGYASQSLSSRQAAESIKSLVGISTDRQFAAATQQQPQHLMRNDASKVAGASRLNQVRRTTRIPETAVEMPSNDSVASMGVQFGAIDISTLGFGNDVSQSFKAVENFDTHMKPVQLQSQGPPNLQKQPLLAPSVYEQKSHVVSSEQSLRASNDLMKSLGAKPSDSIDPRSAKHNVSPKVSDMYSGQQDQRQQPQQQQSFGTSNAYGNQYNSAYGQQAYNAYQSSQSTQQNVQKTSMKELDPPHNRHPSTYDLPSTAGLVNSTQTTNVLKNSLPATGKPQQGMSNRNTTNNPNPMHFMAPPPGVPQPGFYYHPVYDHLQMTGHSTGPQDSSQFAGGYNHLTDNKFGRPEATESAASTGQSSQNPVVSQQQPFMGHSGPPGYSGAFYYMPPMMAPQGYFIPPASTAQIPPPTGFAKNNYGSAYPANLYEGTGLNLQSSDYGMKQTTPYGQSSQPQSGQTKALTNDLMSGSSVSSTQQQSYGKPHGQTAQKVSQPANMTHSSIHHSMTSTDRLLSSSLKMNYPANQGYSLNTGNQTSYGNSYMTPQMNQGFNDGNQTRPGMTAGPKPPNVNTNKAGYGQNLYSNNW